MKLHNGEKKPSVPWKKHQETRPAEDDLRGWMRRPSTTGIAIITGPASGPLATRDFDSVPAYEQWREANATLAREIPTVRTRRGYHVYAASDLQKTHKLIDGEYRGRGLTVAPRSLRDGFAYEWITPLPKGSLPQVEHRVLIGGNVAEIAECHCSAVSAISATSPPTPSPSGLSAVSAISATCPAEFVIAATLPQVVGERNMKLLSLARGLKFNSGLAGTAASALRPLVRQWHDKALRVIGTKDFDTTWSDFLHAWERARHPLGMNLVDAAAERVDPNDLPEVAANYGETTQRLIGLCAALASMNGADRRFFLSSHDAAKRLGIEPAAAWRLLKMLCHDRVLQRLEPGNERRATRYRFVGALSGKGSGNE